MIFEYNKKKRTGQVNNKKGFIMMSLVISIIIASILATITYSRYQVVEPDGTVVPIEEKAADFVNDLNEKKEREEKEMWEELEKVLDGD